jgi:hypothetical protein
MVTILSVNDIILNLINLLQLSQPTLDTKPGTVARDLVIDAPSSQIALIYDELSKVSSQQSLRLVVGSDLDKLAKNFGLTRQPAVAANGVALLTFASIQGTININSGDLVTASNGFSFSILNGVSITAAQSNFYKSVATTYANDLQFVGITDQYAAQVTVQATTAGSAGNIAQYSLISSNSPGVTNVTNASAFTGGSDQEDDATFRNRVLAIFSGSSVGTALGYKNTALATTGVSDAYVIGPGDPLMTRDGTVTTTDAQGNITIVSEGTGGKVNVAILGTNLVQYTDSYIYQDKSNKNDPIATANNFVLGQIPSNANMTFNQKRLTDIAAGTLPAQPVNVLLQVTGSISGANFIAATTDANGVITGNYELIKDTSVYAGSPWGFDTFHWISNQITNFGEDGVKGQFNGQDNTTYSNVLQIPSVQQNISITNENSTVVYSNNSLIQLLHTPATNVTRVFNVNTGEQYIITNQNPNGTGLVNTSGIIQISGNTLPTPSNVLQVDYSWVVTYDQFMDYDGKLNTNNPRAVDDSVDWGYSNLVHTELVTLSLNSSSTFFTGNTTLPITTVISAGIFAQATGIVTQVISGTFAGRLSVVLNNLPVSTTSVDHVYFQHTYNELYNTAQDNGSYLTAAVVIGIEIEYTTTIILPTDTIAQIGSGVTVIMNTADTFNIIGSTGSFTQNQITIPASNITSSTAATTLGLNVVYITNIQNFFTSGITSLPISRIGNGYVLSNSNGFNNNNPANTARREFQVVQMNLSNQFYVELNLSSLVSSLIPTGVVSIIRLADGIELWNADLQSTTDPGIIITDPVTNNYQLVFSSFSAAAAGNSVLIIYYSNDISQFQPFSFSNSIIERDFGTIQYNNVTNDYIVNMHNFTTVASGVQFQILQPDTNIIIADGYDGYIIPNSPANTANFASISTVNFGNIYNSNNQLINILYYKIRIMNTSNPNNNNIYDIISYNAATDEIVIGNNLSEIGIRQVSIIRLIDGQELWSDSGTISNNQLVFPKTSNANPLDQVLVLFYKYNNLKQASTRIAVNIADQVVNTGTITFSGTTLIKAASVLFTATASGLTQNLISAYKNVAGIPSNVQLPTNVKIAKIAVLQKVITTTPGGGEVLKVVATYDTTGSIIQDNTFFIGEFFSNLSLGNFDFILPSTANNTQNAPNIGDTLQVTFYYITLNDTENVSFYEKRAFIYK